MIPVLKYKKSLVFSAFGIPARLAGYLLSEGRFRKPEQLPEFRNFRPYCPGQREQSEERWTAPGLVLVRHQRFHRSQHAVTERITSARKPPPNQSSPSRLQGIPGSPTSSVMVVFAWRRPAQRHFQFPEER